MTDRTASIERNTLETQISISINLDGTGKAKFDTAIRKARPIALKTVSAI
jgi:imidazoleglycerol-phosphate dehydratase